MALNLGELVFSLVLRDQATEAVAAKMAKAAAEVRAQGGVMNTGMALISGSIQRAMSKVGEAMSVSELQIADFAMKALLDLADADEGVGKFVSRIMDLRRVLADFTGVSGIFHSLAVMVKGIVQTFPGLDLALAAVGRGLLRLIGIGPNLEALGGVAVRVLTSIGEALAPIIARMPQVAVTMMRLIQAAGGLETIVDYVQTFGSVFSVSFGLATSAYRMLSSESGRSVVKIVAGLALLVAAVIIARKVITGQMGAVRGAFLALSPLGLVFYGVSSLIRSGMSRISSAIAPAVASVRSGAAAMAKDIRTGATRIKGAADEAVTVVKRLNTIHGVFSALGTFVQTSSNIVKGALLVMASGAVSFGQATLTATPMVAGLAAKAGTMLAGLGAGVAVAGGVVASVFAGITAGIAALGIKAAMESKQVKAAFDDLKKSVKADMADAAQVLQKPLQQAAGSLKTMFSSQIAPALKQMFGQIAPLIGQVTKGLGDFLKPMLPAIQGVVGAVGPMITQLAGSLGGLGTQLAGFLNPISQALGQNSGLLAQFILGIGGLLQALGPLVASVVQVAGVLMGPLMGALSSVAQSLAATLGPVLVTMAPQIGQIITAVGGLISALLPILPPVLQIAAVFAGSLMPILVKVAQALAAALVPALQSLTPSIKMIGTAFGQLIMSLTPLFGPLARLIAQLITGLVPAITPLIPVVGQIAAALGGVLVQALMILVQAVTPLLPPITQVATLFGQMILQAIQQLSPFITQFAQILGQLLAAVLPILPPIMQLAMSLLPPLTQLVAALAPYLLKLAEVITSVVGALAPLLPPLIQLGSSVLPLVIGVITAIVKLLRGDFQGALNTIKAAVSKFGDTIKSAFSKLGGLGMDLLRGIWNGINSGVGWLRDKIYGFFSNIMPGWVKQALGIKSPSTVMAAIGGDTMKGLVVGLTGEEPKIKETIKKLTDAVKAGFAAGLYNKDWEGGLLTRIKKDNTLLQQYADERAKIVKTIADALAYAQQTADSLKNFANISNTDWGDGGPTASSVKSALSAKLQQIKTFASVIKKLAAKGLNKSIMQQVIEAGPEGGTELGQAILSASASDFKAINSTAAAIDKAAKQAGKNAADAMFDAGKNAGKGFLTGLKSQEKEIEKVMQNIAKALVTTIKKELKIKSPSQVFAELGGFSMQGLAVGLRAAAPQVMATATGIAGQLAKSFGGPLDVPKTARTGGPGTKQPGHHTKFEIHNYYPQAEPTSKSMNRGLQYAASVGLAS